MNTHPQSNHPAEPSPVFTPAVATRYVGILRSLAAASSPIAEVISLVDALSGRLQELELEARASEAGAQRHASARWQVYSALSPLLRSDPRLGAPESGLPRLLSACSIFERLLHSRFEITQDWFSQNVPTWERIFEPWSGQPNLSFLEIGSFEGLSACWLIERVLTHEASRITCIDPFDAPNHPHVEIYFDHNVAKTGKAHKVTKLKGYSQSALPLLSGNRYQVIYIDGSHHPKDTLQDALASWPLLASGGLLIFDDYGMSGSYPPEVAAVIDPAPGIRAFLGFVTAYDIVHDGWQLVVRKR